MSSQYGPYELGDTRATMASTKWGNNLNWSKTVKACRSPDCSLKFGNMKLELLVIVNQNVTVNSYLDLVHTARHAMEICYIGSIFGMYNLIFKLIEGLFEGSY